MIRAALLLGLWILASAAARAQAPAERVIAGLSQNRVSINANFDGSEILVFGAIKRDAPAPEDPPLEVIVTVTGPQAPVTVRKKNREFGIWINTAAVEIDAAPRLYAIATTAPLFEILSHTEDLRHRISIPRAIRSVGAPPEISDAAQFSEALVRLRRASGHYRVEAGEVTLKEDTLFQASFDLPANLTEGIHTVRIFLTRGQRVIDQHSTAIDVRKVGLERFLYSLAHERPMAYAILAIALATIAGWGASAAFRFIRN